MHVFISVCSFLSHRWQINLVSAFLALQPFLSHLSFCIPSNVQIWWFAISAKRISFPRCLIVSVLCFFAGWKKRQISSRQKIKQPELMKKNEPFLITAIKCNGLMQVPCQGWKTDRQVPEKHLLICLLDQLEFYCTRGEQYRTSSWSGANTDDIFIHSQPDCLVLCPFCEKWHSGNRPLTAKHLGMGLLFVSAWAEHHQRCQTAGHELRVLKHHLYQHLTAIFGGKYLREEG